MDKIEVTRCEDHLVTEDPYHPAIEARIVVDSPLSFRSRSTGPAVPYDELLGLFGFGSLELRRRVASLMFLYKLVRGVVDDPASLAVLSYRVPSFNSRSKLLFAVPFCRTTAHASSPLYRIYLFSFVNL
ncbi:hypothetical protein J6590_098666 [Homalodisca vitripennis]|nr:hypothetical protein J6590_098666 [Homalodisca vitripennis]